ARGDRHPRGGARRAGEDRVAARADRRRVAHLGGHRGGAHGAGLRAVRLVPGRGAAVRELAEGDVVTARSALVTGGAGFIGSHLVDALLERGWSVRVLDDFSTGRESNLAQALPHIELVRADLADFETTSKALAGVEVVFHQGAIPSVPRSVSDPLRTHPANI